MNRVAAGDAVAMLKGGRTTFLGGQLAASAAVDGDFGDVLQRLMRPGYEEVLFFEGMAVWDAS